MEKEKEKEKRRWSGTSLCLLVCCSAAAWVCGGGLAGAGGGAAASCRFRCRDGKEERSLKFMMISLFIFKFVNGVMAIGLIEFPKSCQRRSGPKRTVEACVDVQRRCFWNMSLMWSTCFSWSGGNAKKHRHFSVTASQLSPGGTKLPAPTWHLKSNRQPEHEGFPHQTDSRSEAQDKARRVPSRLPSRPRFDAADDPHAGRKQTNSFGTPTEYAQELRVAVHPSSPPLRACSKKRS